MGVCIEAKLKSVGNLDVAPGFSGSSDLCDTCFDFVGPEKPVSGPQIPGNGKCDGNLKGHRVNGYQNCDTYKRDKNCKKPWFKDVCKKTCNHCQPKKFKACAICDPCHDSVGPDANTPATQSVMAIARDMQPTVVTTA